MIDNPFLERYEDMEISTGDVLPHWHQNEKIQYITFRLADSLPQNKIQELKQTIESFHRFNPEPWNQTVKLKYHKTVGSKYEQFIDNGYGECILKNKRCRDILKETIQFYDGIKYDTLAFVIMPNHVHLLLRLREKYKLNKIIQSIKRHSAYEINRLLNRTGEVWMKRYYDRIVRNEDNLKHYYSYIINNPRFLKSDDYYLYVDKGGNRDDA